MPVDIQSQRKRRIGGHIPHSHHSGKAERCRGGTKLKSVEMQCSRVYAHQTGGINGKPATFHTVQPLYRKPEFRGSVIESLNVKVKAVNGNIPEIEPGLRHCAARCIQHTATGDAYLGYIYCPWGRLHGVGHDRYFRRICGGDAGEGSDIGGVKSACPERFNGHTLVLKVDNAPGKGGF